MSHAEVHKLNSNWSCLHVSINCFLWYGLSLNVALWQSFFFLNFNGSSSAWNIHLLLQMLPPGDWLCSNCSCRFCGGIGGSTCHDDGVTSLLSCSQCEGKCTCCSFFYVILECVPIFHVSLLVFAFIDMFILQWRLNIC